ncbi:hypothetical protein [Rhodovulum euryhalinum]|uniref:Uncharacterized protein n=1 Tax=Rhodovulum euryhalinum TaxID=35805 RepID=A0A4R2KQK8_9RHOB|nr:hypothetical protein [Rhodovulum euryhalinum]TCO72418.1 hypothetical protein EV655_104105 [Rhodovulum euryhalinum]
MNEQGHIGTNLAIWGVVTASAVASLLAFGPHWAVWAASLAAFALWLFAILGLSDGPSRAFLAGTLKKSSYTQIYTTLTRRNVMWVWRRLCDEASDRDGWPTLFRAALTWRLYDKALLIAVAYPVLLLVGQWIVTGAEGRVGSFVVLPAAPFWPDRAATLVVFGILILGFVARTLAAASRHRVVRQAADWLLILAFAAAFAFAVAFAAAFAVAVAVAGAVGFAVAVAALAAVEWLDLRGKPILARWLVTGAVVLSVVLLARVLDWSAVPEDRRSLFLFLAVFPLINALFDVLSYAVTLSLLRRGLRSGLPFLWGLLDLAIACVLFLALGVTLVAAIDGLNRLAGVPLLDLGALFAGIRETPGAHVWLYLMLFSTIVPTALHFLVSLLGLQGVWPRALRRPVAVLIDRAPDSPLEAVRAALALGLIWAIPLILLGAALWGLWALGGGMVSTALARYFDVLLWIAAEPLAAF